MELQSMMIPELQELAHKLSEPTLNFGLPLAYLAVILTGYAVMKKQQAFVIPQWFKVTYNFLQVSLSLYTMAFGMAVVTDFVQKPFGIGLPLTQNTVQSDLLHYCVCVHFLSKFVDYVDTVLIVLCKKDEQLSLLHVYHHVSISMVWGYLINSGWADGTVCFGAWINAVIHSVMYFYYMLTALKMYSITNPIKIWVTRLQLIQFCSCITHAISVIVLEDQIPTPLAMLQFGYHCTMIALFGEFYIRTYKQKKAAKKAKKAAGDKAK